MVTALPCEVASRGRVGCGVEDHERSYSSGVNAASGWSLKLEVAMAEVGIIVDGGVANGLAEAGGNEKGHRGLGRQWKNEAREQLVNKSAQWNPICNAPYCAFRRCDRIANVDDANLLVAIRIFLSAFPAMTATLNHRNPTAPDPKGAMSTMENRYQI